MARMSGTTWRPLASDWAEQSRLTRFDLVILHTMVGSLWGTDGYFKQNGYGGTESHFGVGYDGEILQWQDTSRRADANLNGNHRAISIETADYGVGFPKWNLNDGSQVPAWTPRQLEAIAEIVAWSCKTHDIPCVLIPDALPHRKGIGYHRQGVPGFMVSGAEKWSNSRGKVCPGNRRISQIPYVISRAQQILGQTPVQPVQPITPVKSEDEDMSQEQVDQINNNIGFARDQILAVLGSSEHVKRIPALANEGWPVRAARRDDLGFARDQILTAISVLAPLTESIKRGGEGETGETSLRAMIAWNDASHSKTRRELLAAIEELRSILLSNNPE